MVASLTRKARATSRGRQARHRLEGQGYPPRHRQRRVAAGEQQAEAVIGEHVGLLTILPRDRSSPFQQASGAHRAWPARPAGAGARRAPGGGRWSSATPQGCRGTPSAGQWRKARSTASWTQSSARSQLPVTRMSVEMMRRRSVETASCQCACVTLPAAHVRRIQPSLSGQIVDPPAARAARCRPSDAAKRSRSPRRDRCTRGPSNPAIHSLDSVNGPSVTRSSPLANASRSWRPPRGAADHRSPRRSCPVT